MTFWLSRVALDIFLFITAPIVFAFIPRSWDRMPKSSFLRYYEDFNYGINGDPYWINPDLEDHPANDAEARSYLWRVRWSWRNANTYDHEHGMDTRSVLRLEYSGDPETSNRPGHAGEVEISCWDVDGKQYDCKYVVRQWGTSGRCYRAYTGYKLMDILEWWIRHDGNNMTHAERVALMDSADLRRIAQRVWSVNPLMGFEKANHDNLV